MEVNQDLVNSIVQALMAANAKTPKSSASESSSASKTISSQLSAKVQTPKPITSSATTSSSVRKSLQKNVTLSNASKTKANKRDDSLAVQSKKKRLIYDDNHTHTLVHWLCDKKYSVVQISAVQTDDIVVEGLTYKIHFNKSVYDGKIITLGSLDSCKKHLESMSRQTEREQNKENESVEVEKETSKRNKEPRLSFDEDKSTRVKELETENVSLKTKIAELKLLNEENIKTNDSLRNENSSLRERISLLEQTITPEERKKYYIHSMNYLKLFGPDVNKSDNHNVPLVFSYPNVQVSPVFLIDMSELLSDKSITPSSVFRKIIKAIMPDQSEWGMLKASEVISKHQNEISASYEFINSKRPEFKFKDLKSTLAQLIVDCKKEKKSNLAQSSDDLEQTLINENESSKKIVSALDSSLDYDNDLTLNLESDDERAKCTEML